MAKTAQIAPLRMLPDSGPTAPESLSVPARALWDRLVAEYDFGDALGQVLLAEALAALDRSWAAAAMLARDGAVITGPDGQPRRHPANSIERDSRAQAVRLIRELGLNLEPVNSVGRPAGR